MFFGILVRDELIADWDLEARYFRQLENKSSFYISYVHEKTHDHKDTKRLFLLNS
jgi:hypothetical protein